MYAFNNSCALQRTSIFEMECLLGRNKGRVIEYAVTFCFAVISPPLSLPPPPHQDHDTFLRRRVKAKHIECRVYFVGGLGGKLFLCKHFCLSRESENKIYIKRLSTEDVARGKQYRLFVYSQHKSL